MTGTAMEYLTDALGQVMVSMVSLPVHPVDPPSLPDMKTDAFNVRIEFTGEHTGELSIIMERPLASLITCSILGIEDTRDADDAMIEDALKELANVVCGHFVTLMFGYTPVFRISLPRVLTIGSAACNMLRNNPLVASLVAGTEPLMAIARLK
jgi:chemotaxis protein CheY-P-specific phosphatase CheC